MIEFPVDVLGSIKSMFLRSVGNPNAFKYTINGLLDAYKTIIIMIFLFVFMRFLVKFIYKLIGKVKENKNNKEKSLKKQDIKDVFLEEKSTFKILKYPIIGSILVSTCWMQVSLLFWLLGKYNNTQPDIIRETLPGQENWVLGIRSLYSLCFFLLAGCFIGLSFGNKMLRNIGILIYAIGILFIFFAFFLDNGAISNGLSNFTI